MPTKLEPEKSIIPIFKSVAEDLKTTEFLGTGFIVGTSGNLKVITAKYVFKRNPLEKGEAYYILFREAHRTTLNLFSGFHLSKEYDVAVFDGKNLPEAVPLKFAREHAPLTADVFTYEYSTTRIERRIGEKTNVSLEPLAHKGNVMRYYVSTFPETKPTPSFLTSFPALEGASGAPVLSGTKSKNFAVVGMLVQNQESQLLPAQVVRTEEGDSFKEETKYFLPLGKGIASEVLVGVLQELNENVEYAD